MLFVWSFALYPRARPAELLSSLPFASNDQVVARVVPVTGLVQRCIGNALHELPRLDRTGGIRLVVAVVEALEGCSRRTRRQDLGRASREIVGARQLHSV